MNPNPDNPDPFHQARRSMLETIVANGTCTQSYRRAVLLAKEHDCPSMKGKSQRDIAKMLGISEAAISKRVKCLHRLYPYLQRENDGDADCG